MTDKQPTVIASLCDTALQCGLAAQPPEVPLDTSGPEADLGRAAHSALEPWVDAGFEGEPDPQPAANAYGVDAKAVAALIEPAPAAIAAIREDLSQAKAEVRVEGGGTRGRIDVQSLVTGRDGLFSAAVLDWKTGRDSDGGKPAQRLAYASAIEAMHGMPAQGYIYTAEIWLATEEIIETRYDLDAIEGFRVRLAEQLKYAKGSPGRHCKYCPHRFACVPRDQWLRSAATALMDFGPDALVREAEVGPSQLMREAVASLWDQSRLLRKALEHYEAAVDSLIDVHGGVDLPDDRRLIHGIKTLSSIDARKAWPVMRKAGLTNDDINAVVSIGKTKLLDAIAAKAPRGKKGEAKSAINAALDEAGAISRNTSKFRKTIKVGK